MINGLLLITLSVTSVAPAPWQTTIRIHVGDQIRSGVVIQSTDNFSVAITAGHEWEKLPYDVEVHLFDGVLRQEVKDGPAHVSYARKCAGRLILLDTEEDYAYIRFYPGGLVPVSPIAKAWQPRVGERLTTSGSSEGANPTFWSTEVEIIKNRAVLCSYAPNLGRSGGGLFNDRWELVGMCVGRLPKEDRGYYLRLKRPQT